MLNFLLLHINSLPLLVANLRQVFFGKHEDLSLIAASELHINAQVFFVERLQNGVEQWRHERRGDLFNDFSTGLEENKKIVRSELDRNKGIGSMNVCWS